MIIGVIGSGYCPPELAKIAEEVGKLIAEKRAILICGALKGVMEATCRGAKQAGGITIGVIPGFSKKEANPYVDIPIVTGMDQGRNIIIIRSSDAVIAIGGGYGTLSEIAFALKLNIPVVGIKTWILSKEGGREIKDLIVAETPQDAVEKAIKLAGGKLG